MGARIKGRVVVGGVVIGLALLAFGPGHEAQALGDQRAWLQVYNAEGPQAVDVQMFVGQRRVSLAAGLRPGEAGPLMSAAAGRVKLEARVAGAGKARLIRRSLRMEVGGRYCVIAQGQQALKVLAVSDKLLLLYGPDKVCREAAQRAP
jgi:hypothetical protein